MDSPSASPTSTAVGTAIQVMDKLPDTLSKLIDTLSIKLGATGKALFEILIKQQYVSGLQSVFDILSLSILLYIWWAKLYPLCMSKLPGVTRSGDSNGKVPLTIVATILTALAVIFICAAVEEALGHFINPQYYAIKDLMDMVK